jgi:hypothetical protein
MLRRTLLAAAIVLLPVGLIAVPGGIASASSAVSPATATCSGVIQITRLAFNPTAVPPGQLSTASVVARNCTGQTQQTTVMWLGSYPGAASGLPPGCPGIDPLGLQVTFGPYARYSSSVGYELPASCTATQFQVTVEFVGGGAVLAQRSAILTLIQPSAG